MVEHISKRILNDIEKNLIVESSPIVWNFYRSMYAKLSLDDLRKIIICRLESTTIEQLYKFQYHYLQYHIVIYTLNGVYCITLNIEPVDKYEIIFRKVSNKTKHFEEHLLRHCTIHSWYYKILR